jgi:multidrug efflux pump subunit AcrB
MWIVRLALNRPYTFIVASILILLLGLSSIATMPTDIFPNIDIPVITVVYDYRGLQAQEMEQRITTFSEFIMSTVNDVKSIDSQTVRGYAVLMIYFQPQVRIDAAMAQVGAATQSIRFRFPAGVNPPWVLRFSASTVPIYQLALSSDTLSQSELYDYGIFRIRQRIAVSAGATRLRPIVMTAFAMIVGMLPMALGLGEGGEQNAPLARAVIGGLSMATFATLFFVPLMYSLVHGKRKNQQQENA